jgi:hypothetical protein
MTDADASPALAFNHFPGGVVAAHRSLLIGGNIKHPDKRIVKLNIAGAVRRAVADHQRAIVIAHQM